MRLRILGCDGGLGPGSRLTSTLVDDRLLIDAGHLAVDGLEHVEAVLLTHAHLDHVLHLPMLLTSGLATERPTLDIRAERATLDRVRGGLMADLVYPDHAPRQGRSGHIVGRYTALDPNAATEIAGYELSCLRMTHDYPCLAFALRTPGATGVIIAGDTSESAPLWRFAAAHDWVRAIVVECSFPDELSELATNVGHLTPRMLAEQLDAGPPLRDDLALLITHLKPECHAQVADELRGHLGDRARILAAEQVITV